MYHRTDRDNRVVKKVSTLLFSVLLVNEFFNTDIASIKKSSLQSKGSFDPSKKKRSSLGLGKKSTKFYYINKLNGFE